MHASQCTFCIPKTVDVYLAILENYKNFEYLNFITAALHLNTGHSTSNINGYEIFTCEQCLSHCDNKTTIRSKTHCANVGKEI